MSLRTLLFVPGDRPDRFAKAVASGADAIILDLEDAIAPPAKSIARAAVREWLRSTPRAAGCVRLVRVNARTTPWFHDDITAIRDLNVDGVLVPKCDAPSDLDDVPGDGLWPMIETAQGLSNAVAIGQVPRVQCLVFGSLDIQLDLGIEADIDESELAPYRAQVVMASRLAGLGPPVDGVTVAYNDEPHLTKAVQRALRQGFGGKLCIHPRQIDVVHAALRPSEADVAHARRVLDAAAASQGAAVALDGTMVDRPVILRAHSILARAGG
jgi:citrate lyase subunit beta/citryl-CoA lyase